MTLSLLWLRRDLRLHDHGALHAALAAGGNVQPVFVLDSDILARFASKNDRRLSFIAQSLRYIDEQLKQRGGGLLVLHGRSVEVIPKLAKTLGAGQVFAAQDFEPATMARDSEVAKQVSLTLVKDHLIFAPDEIVKHDGTPYKVYTPFSKAWLAKASPVSYAPYEIHDQGRYADSAALREKALAAGLRVLPLDNMLAEIGYDEQALPDWPVDIARAILKDFVQQKVSAYAGSRDMVAEQGTSRISPYLRFGLVSVRECFALALNEPSPLEGEGRVGGNAVEPHPLTPSLKGRGSSMKWINELIWREFYAMILWHFPESITQEWNPDFRALEWSYDEAHIAAWKAGKTGYPLIDAAMRQLLTTGWMHNRARMVVASFLTKDLQIDWRVGEEHFAQYLMDYELASNVGGWQWAASTGTDAQPWFRIFNPYLQSKKFDPNGDYIRRYVSELAHIKGDDIHEMPPLLRPREYPAPIVDHYAARDVTLAMFKAVKG